MIIFIFTTTNTTVPRFGTHKIIAASIGCCNKDTIWHDDHNILLAVAMYECCLHRKAINIVKNIIDEDTAKQLKEKQYLCLIIYSLYCSKYSYFIGTGSSYCMSHNDWKTH